MNNRTFIKDKVNLYFKGQDLNCAKTTLNILAEKFEFPLNSQLIDSAAGLNGLGQFGSQCGLATAGVMFIGIVAESQNRTKEDINTLCRGLAEAFFKDFDAIDCHVLRPNGFNEDDPPHLCLPLTVNALELTINYIESTDLLN